MKRIWALAFAVTMFAGARHAEAAQVLYGADGSGGNPSTLYTIDPTTGVGTPIGAIGYAVTGLAFDPTTGILYGGTARLESSGLRGLLTIDPTTGAGTVVGAYGTGFETMSDITFDSNGNLYGFLEPSSDDLYSIDKNTGVATLVGNSPGSALSGIAFDNNDVLYFEQAGNLYILDASTGLVSTFIGSSGLGVGLGIDFDENNVLFAIERLGSGDSSPRNLVTVDTSTGAATVIGSTVVSLDALAFSPEKVVVPEPSSLALLAFGGVGLIAARRRRRVN